MYGALPKLNHYYQKLFEYNQHENVFEKVLNFCAEPRTRQEIAAYCGFKDLRHLSAKYLKPLLESGQLRMTIPENPKDKNQRYVTTNKAQEE